ncbi:phloem protein 2-like protein, partial [Tanacetum coccineum]
FEEVVELQSHQAFSIKCDIETQMLSPDTAYACFLVFQLPENSEGLMCPVKAWDLLNKNNKDTTIIYLKAPGPVDLYRDKRVPENREDGWMEVRVWEFIYNNEIKDNYIPIELNQACNSGNITNRARKLTSYVIGRILRPHRITVRVRVHMVISPASCFLQTDSANNEKKTNYRQPKLKLLSVTQIDAVQYGRWYEVGLVLHKLLYWAGVGLDSRLVMELGGRLVKQRLQDWTGCGL